jgi:hypothetical protein
MTIKAARDKIVEIVEATASTSYGRRGALKFRNSQRPSSDSLEHLPDSGGFWLDLAGQMSMRPMPIHQAHPRRAKIEWVLSIAYRASRVGEVLDLGIATDYAALAVALASPLNWAQNTTGIVTLGMSGSDELFPARVENTDGASILRITIPSEVTL